MIVWGQIRPVSVVILLAAGLAGGPSLALGAPYVAAGDHVITVVGAGPYRIGRSLARLAQAGLLGWVTGPDEAGTRLAGPAGEWRGELELTFRHNVLAIVRTEAGSVRTPAGARVGMPFAEVQRIYGGDGWPTTDDEGRNGYVVAIGPMALVLDSHPSRPEVGSIRSGPARLVLAGRGARRGGTPSARPGHDSGG